MSDKPIVLITGANQGIGYHIAAQLAATGNFTVLLGSRNVEKGQQAVEAIIADMNLSSSVDRNNKADVDIEALQIDVHYDGSIAAAAAVVEEKYGRLDILLNNAGIAGGELPQQGASLREQYHAIYNTNVAGAAVCTEIFLPLLRKSRVDGGKRIVFTSSGLGSLTLASDPEYEFPARCFPVYRSSKTALNMLAVHYAALLGEEGFCVCVVCPGFCETALNGFTGTKKPEDGARTVVKAVVGRAQDVHAKFVHGEVEEGRYPW